MEKYACFALVNYCVTQLAFTTAVVVTRTAVCARRYTVIPLLTIPTDERDRGTKMRSIAF